MDKDHTRSVLDPFGIGEAFAHGARMLMHGQRRSGRTKYLISTVKEGDVVVCASRASAQHVRGSLRDAGYKNVDVVTVDPRHTAAIYASLAMPAKSRRMVFEHGFYETYYSYAIENAMNELSAMKDALDARCESAHGKSVEDENPNRVWDDAVEALNGKL